MVCWTDEGVLINNGLVKRALYLGHKKSCVYNRKKKENRDTKSENSVIVCVLRDTC